jgi:hypothetical protein
MELSNGFHFFWIIDFGSVVFAISWKTRKSKILFKLKSGAFFQIDFDPNQNETIERISFHSNFSTSIASVQTHFSVPNPLLSSIIPYLCALIKKQNQALQIKVFRTST